MRKTPSSSRTFRAPDFGVDLNLNPIDFIKDRVTDVKKLVSSIGNVLSGIPGGNLIVDAANQGAQWTKDIASSDVGNVVLRAMATSLYGPLANQLGLSWFGPQLASVVWALPGVVRGDAFVEAWVTEFTYRAGKTAEVVGGDLAKQAFDGVQPAIQSLIEKAKTQFPGLDLKTALEKLDITPEQLANELGIRPDIAALSLKFAKGNMGLSNMDEYDLANGRKAGTVLQPIQANVGPPGKPVKRLVKLPPLPKKPVKHLGKYSSTPVRGSMANAKMTAPQRANAELADGPPVKTPIITPASGVGGAGGAAIGFMVAGPIGAVVGGILGFFGGHAVEQKK